MLSIFPAADLRNEFDHFCDKLEDDFDFGKLVPVEAIGKLKKREDPARAVIQIVIIIGGADRNFDDEK